MSSSTPTAPDYSRSAAQLLQNAGLGELGSLSPVKGGGNNRVLLATSYNGSLALFKAYFQSPEDPRDRFRHERAFYQLLTDAEISCTPHSLAWNESERLGLFEFINGEKLTPTDVDVSAVLACSSFFTQLNHSRHLTSASVVPLASEACFSLNDHIDLVQKRVNRLTNLGADPTADSEVCDFIRTKLVPAWESIRTKLIHRPGNEQILPQSHRCISPSDFGFHNALQSGRGLVFFDFEYAGWDDPAKMACDFFCQPEIPAPAETLPAFLDATLLNGWKPETYHERVHSLLPAYRVKWTCIILNIFLSNEARRRNFADSSLTTEEARRQQLAKARRQLALLPPH
jgi:hypothetical protein